jgi:hypothetical protein
MRFCFHYLNKTKGCFSNLTPGLGLEISKNSQHIQAQGQQLITSLSQFAGGALCQSGTLGGRGQDITPFLLLLFIRVSFVVHQSLREVWKLSNRAWFYLRNFLLQDTKFVNCLTHKPQPVHYISPITYFPRHTVGPLISNDFAVHLPYPPSTIFVSAIGSCCTTYLTHHVYHNLSSSSISVQ